MRELSIIQKTHDLIKWYVPILNRLPRNHKFILGDRIINQLYNILERLIEAKYAKIKQTKLENINIQLDILRHQTQLLLDFHIFSTKRYGYVSQLIDEIGVELGRWRKSQKEKEESVIIEKKKK
jgi:hypothetical protein